MNGGGEGRHRERLSGAFCSSFSLGPGLPGILDLIVWLNRMELAWQLSILRVAAQSAATIGGVL